MKEHKHADFLRAIADGASLDDFVYQTTDGALELGDFLIWNHILVDKADVTITRKPKTRIINGFEVPAPEIKEPSRYAEYFVPCLSDSTFASKQQWDCLDIDKRWLDRGLVHLTREAAVANAKAMCGIDPKGEDK